MEPVTSVSKLSHAIDAIMFQPVPAVENSSPYLPTKTVAAATFTDLSHIIGHIIYLNNVACINTRKGNKELSCVYFGKALYELSVLENATGSSSLNSLLSPIYLTDIFYNAGVSYLLNENPAIALDCFNCVYAACRNLPMYWLRRAESLIMLHKGSDEPVGDVKPTNDLQFAHFPQNRGKFYMRYVFYLLYNICFCIF